MNTVRFCLLVSSVALCVALYALLFDGDGSADTTARHPESAARVDVVSRAEFERLQAANAELRRQLAALAARPYPDPDPAPERNDNAVEALASRVAALEWQVRTGASPEERIVVSGEERKALLAQHADEGPFNPLAAQTWEQDDGIPLARQHADRIFDAVHASNDQIDVVGMDCRETACRLIYAPLDADSDFDLAAMLGSELGGVSLRIRYARDDFGNDVAYIEMNE